MPIVRMTHLGGYGSSPSGSGLDPSLPRGIGARVETDGRIAEMDVERQRVENAGLAGGCGVAEPPGHEAGIE
jgi:hypothetical protein